METLQPIIDRYLRELAQLDEVSERSAAIRHQLGSLMFAKALERKLPLIERFPQHPLQVVIVGPTQVGKSTLVNALLGIENTEASARAGYTVHCHGFACGAANDDWLPAFYEGMTRQPIESLQRGVLDEYSYSDVTERLPEALVQRYKQTTFWDTPDFDSVASFHYRSPVLQTIALADLVVMVTSKEKYADKSVWDTLETLARAGKEVVFVMNKTPPAVRDELLDSVRSKYRSIRERYPDAELSDIVFIDEVQDPTAELSDSAEVEQLRDALLNNLKRGSDDAVGAGLRQLVSTHWHDWVQPITEQHELQQRWRHMVQTSSAALTEKYEQEFLNNSTRHRETFQLAVAELLVLLEVPGMAEPLTRIRNLVTWPVRKVISAATGDSATSDSSKDKRTEERRLLEELFDHGLTDLSVQIAEQTDHAQWWQTLASKLNGTSESLYKGYNNELDNYQTLLKVETERAARALYTRLQEQPATLNSLRAARVSADAAAVVLAVKSGGLGAVDLVIAPAMLSVTTMLTESALGQYMKKVQQDLKTYQKKSVAALFNRKFTMKLNALSTDADISPQQLEETARRFNVASK